MTDASAVPAVPRAEPVEFSGSATTYFGIWIVNILLTIVTLGIYSAWAKVRRLRYFYGNTSLMGHAFEYHANPIAILKGRLIVMAVLVAYNLLLNFFPLYGLVLFILLLLLVPFAIMLSFRFNARVTSWRNVRFFFDYQPKRDFLPAVGVLGLMPIVASFTFFILWPLVARMRWQLVLKRLQFGRHPMREAIPLGPLYRAFGLAVLVGIVGFIVQGVTMTLFGAFATGRGPTIDMALVVATMFAGFLLALPIFLVAYAIFQTAVRNTVVNHSEIVGVGHGTSRIRAWPLAAIYLTNTLAILCTLGLATPWAATRLWRYQVETVSFTPRGDLDAILDIESAEGTAVGAEWADFEGIDLGF